jgi:hypothetical protein
VAADESAIAWPLTVEGTQRLPAVPAVDQRGSHAPTMAINGRSIIDSLAIASLSNIAQHSGRIEISSVSSAASNDQWMPEALAIIGLKAASAIDASDPEADNDSEGRSYVRRMDLSSGRFQCSREWRRDWEARTIMMVSITAGDRRKAFGLS